jgi:signal transduction histidine kinase
MNVVVCLLVGMNAHSRAVAQTAAEMAFPEAIVKQFDSLDEALKSELRPEIQLLALANPGLGELSKAVKALDPGGFRRWAIVAGGTIASIEGVETISIDDWKESVLACLFRSAVNQHALMRENERIRGDLRTISHRVIHDLRSSLGGILSAGEALEEELAEHNKSSGAIAKPLFDSVDDLEKLIDRLSLMSKATAHPVLKEPVAMQEVVLTVLQRLECQRLNMDLVKAHRAPWPEVNGVFSWLETIWWELLVKARQHGNDSTRIELGWTREPQTFRFWVRDGKGPVPHADLNELFHPFHRLHESNTKLDLSLSIVRRLVELQGGQCGYETHPEGGSGFFFTLPSLVNAPIATINTPQQFLVNQSIR